MTLSLDDDINRMSQDVYKSFFLSLDEGKSLDSFLTTWSNLECLVGSHQHELKPATLQMVHSLADVVGAVASSFLQLGDVASQIVRDTEDEVTRIFKELLIEDAVGKSSDSRKVLSQSSFPPYMNACYRWLMKNLHNPYPSKVTRQRIAKEAHSTTKDIENWFADARKRIGWNDLRRRYFANRKDFIVKAATQFFKPASGPVNVELLRYSPYFAAVLASAENLYSGGLLAELDSPSTNCRATSSSSAAVEATLQYPSPASSPSSPITSLPPAVSAPARKHRISEDALCSESESDLRPRKLARPSISMELAMASLPSPAPSSLDLDRSDFAFVDESDTSNPTPDKLTGKRKRCVSESDLDCQPNTKRVHTADCHNRHTSPGATIKSPYPDQLIQSMMTVPSTFSTAIPGPVTTVEAIDNNSNVEISIFDYDFGPGHCVADHLTADVESSYGFVRSDPTLSTDFDLNIGNLLGNDLYMLNPELDALVLPDNGDFFQPFAPPCSLQLIPRSPQSTFEWMLFNPGYTLDTNHRSDTFRTSTFADCNFSSLRAPEMII